MKLRVLCWLCIVTQIWAIKESSKQMLLNMFPDYNDKTKLISVGRSIHPHLQRLPLSASADKYADVLLHYGKLYSRPWAQIKTVGHRDYSYAIKMLDAIEKLSEVEKVSPRKLEKARTLKQKIR